MVREGGSRGFLAPVSVMTEPQWRTTLVNLVPNRWRTAVKNHLLEPASRTAGLHQSRSNVDAQPFGLDAEVKELGTASRKRFAHSRDAVGGRNAEHAPAPAGAADLGRLRPGAAGASDQVVDLRRAHPRGQPLTVAPLLTEVATDGVPVRSLQGRAHRNRGIPNALEAIEDMAIAIDVPLHDFPVVGARVTGRTRVAQDDAAFEFLRIHRQRYAGQTVRAELECRDSAVHRGPIVLETGRHFDRLSLDVHRSHQQGFGAWRRCTGRGIPPRQGPTNCDVQRRRTGDASASRRLGPGAQGHTAHAVCRGQSPQQRQGLVVSQGVGRGGYPSTGVLGNNLDLIAGSGLEARVGADANRGVQRLRAVVEQIQRPDVDGAARQIDPRRRRSSNTHAHIIILRTIMPLTSTREIGQLLIGSFPGTSISPELRSLARDFDFGGAILFSRNVEAPEQVVALSAEVEALGRTMPAWVSIDQEGGRVARLKEPFTRWPPMAVLGRAGSEPLAERFSRALARELAAVGITLDYAPVLDIQTNPKNAVIGDRALAQRADEVARLGTVIIRTLQDEGVAACGKHFPGHGDTVADSHFELPLVEHPPDRLRAVEFEPFRAAIREGVAFIMTAHVLVPALDEKNPATLSPAIVKGLLRDELGYDGVILSDDLEMKAISAQMPVTVAAVKAIGAGCDGLLVCSGDVETQAAVLEALVKAGETGAISATRFDDAIKRLKRAKERFLAAERPKPAARLRVLRSVIGQDEHRAIAAEMASFL